jgi:hypothetical protein
VRWLREHSTCPREATKAWLLVSASWSLRALALFVLLAALGVGFSPTLALVVLCLSAAAALIPIASGGAVANVGATAAILLALGVHKEQAINFGLASGLLLCATAAAAALAGVSASLVAGARRRFADEGLAERAECVEGDFFAALPAGASAYLLSRVIHDWGDEDAVRILESCHAAMADGARLAIVEFVLPERMSASPEAMPAALLTDMLAEKVMCSRIENTDV